MRNKNGIVALLSIIAAFVQLIGYGTGFFGSDLERGNSKKRSIKIINTIYMKFALHTSTAISSVLKEPEHFYVDIYYLIILIIVAFTLLLLSFLRYHLYKTKRRKN